MMGLGASFFVTLATSGMHVQTESYDPVYCSTDLFPCLERFCLAPSAASSHPSFCCTHDGV